MAVRFKSFAGKVSAVALAISAIALSATAEAQDHDRRFRENAANADNEVRRGGRTAQAEDRDQTWSRPAQTAAQAAPAGAYQQGRAAQAPGWSRSADRRDGNGWNGSGRSGEHRGGGNWRGRDVQASPAPQIQAAPTRVIQGRSWTDSRSVQQNDNRWRERDGRRDEYRRDGDRRWDSNRTNHQRYGYNQDYRRWDNRWRDNRRYDWYSYRRSSPSTFRLGLYYSPYRNYSYRRLNIGFFLDSLFFSNRYWINDPWQYRLPDVYGPYRWVRYYDDALLVNIYTGEVTDVIYSFFW